MSAASNFKDVYQQTTDLVIDSLEKGDVIWHQSWNSLGLPKNITTGNEYRGWNVFWLNFHTLIKGYKTPFYLTFNQAKTLKGSIRKGERGTRITYWATVEDRMEKSKTGSMNESTDQPRQKVIPAIHTVFNLDQTEGIELPKVEALFKTDLQKIAACEMVVEQMPHRPCIEHSGDQAYYQKSVDKVNMPFAQLFHSNHAYYITLFHELAHSTGHPSRLYRKELLEYDGFGGENYSKEELTAELTAAFLSAITGIQQETIRNSAAYIKGWLKALKNDKRLVLTAASQAQKAADYILGNSAE